MMICEYNAAAKCMFCYSFQHGCRLFQRMTLNKGCNGNLAGQYHLQRRRILFCRASPVAARGSVKCHEVGEPQLNFLRRESHHSQVSSEIEQAESGDLAGRRAAHLKNLEPRALVRILLEEVTHR